MKNVLWIVLALISVTIFGFRIAEGIAFKRNVSGYLKRAASANTIELANQELTRALDYLEANDLTTGYTSILYQTPDEDIDFWYRNLKASQLELQNLKSDSALERTNVLMKLRETLLTSGENAKVSVPDGLAVYPHNLFWAVLMWIAILTGFSAFIIIAVESDKKAKRLAAKQSKG